MNKKILKSQLVFSVGLIIVFIAIFPFRINFQIPNYLLPIGLIVLLIGFIYGLLIVNKMRIHINGNKRISSRYTFWNKLYLPLLLIAFLFFNTLLIGLNIYPGKDISIFITLEILFVIWIILALPNFKLYMIYLNKNNIIITNYFKKFILPLNSIISINRYLIFFYMMKIKKDNIIQNIIFIPQKDIFPNIFKTPISILELKDFINKSKISS